MEKENPSTSGTGSEEMEEMEEMEEREEREEMEERRKTVIIIMKRVKYCFLFIYYCHKYFIGYKFFNYLII